ncbi:MAG: hypothetical protein ABJH45_21395 [Paracoccaceae bacterium]
MYRLFHGALILNFTLPTTAFAGCSAGLELFNSCQIADRNTEVSVCFDSERVEYNYGPIGETPELTLTDTIINAEYVPWSGVGKAIWEYTVFRNGEYAYEVGAGFDRPFSEDEQMSDEERHFGWISITQNGSELGRLECIPDTVSYAFGAGIYDEKTTAGLMWDGIEEKWFWDPAHFEEAARNTQPLLTREALDPEMLSGPFDCIPRSEIEFNGIPMLDEVEAVAQFVQPLQNRLDSGVSIGFEKFSHNGLVITFVGDDDILEIFATTPDWVTPSGLHVGMSRAQVVSILGRLPHGRTEATGPFHLPVCVVDEALGKRGMTIHFDKDQQVSLIDLHTGR